MRHLVIVIGHHKRLHYEVGIRLDKVIYHLRLEHHLVLSVVSLRDHQILHLNAIFRYLKLLGSEKLLVGVVHKLTVLVHLVVHHWMVVH
jgi:hypothetical protein